MLQVVRDATFTKAPEGRQKAKLGRKVNPTSVDKPVVNRNFAAAVGAASAGSPLPDRSPAAGQLSASTAPESAQPGRSWPSLSDPSGLASPVAMPAPALTPASKRIQPSPLPGRAVLVSAVTRNDEPRGNSGAATQHSLERHLEDTHVVSEASDCATAGSSQWAQHAQSPSDGAAKSGSSGSPWAQRPSESAAVPGGPWGPGQPGSGAQQSSAKQNSLERRLGDSHMVSEASDCATAGSSPWGQRNQTPSDGSALPGSPWGRPGAGPSASRAPLSSAASNTPCRGGFLVSRSMLPSAATPGSRATMAPAATPGSAVSVTSRFKPCEQQCASAGTTASCPPETPISMPHQVDGVSRADQESAPGVAGAQSPSSSASLNICGEASAVAHLPDQARRAAALQSALIQHTAVAQLAAELDSLIRLLAAPCAAHDEAGNGQPALFPSGRAAAQYACAVLIKIGERLNLWKHHPALVESACDCGGICMRCLQRMSDRQPSKQRLLIQTSRQPLIALPGALGEALPLPLMEALASNAALNEHAPGLALTLQESLSRRHSAAAHLGSAQVPASSAFAVHAFTSDGQARRSKVSTPHADSLAGCPLQAICCRDLTRTRTIPVKAPTCKL